MNRRIDGSPSRKWLKALGLTELIGASLALSGPPCACWKRKSRRLNCIVSAARHRSAQLDGRLSAQREMSAREGRRA